MSLPYFKNNKELYLYMISNDFKEIYSSIKDNSIPIIITITRYNSKEIIKYDSLSDFYMHRKSSHLFL